jgi:hypothetical protein
MGLGLYICRNIVERHGGRIAARSSGEGRGTTFEITLPCRPIGARPPAPDEAPAPEVAPSPEATSEALPA